MMMPRNIYEALGDGQRSLDLWRRGTLYNFCLAVMGYDINIYPTKPLYHFAEKRGYNWNYDDWVRNRMIATFCFGDGLGVEVCKKL